jgi:RimJ/RimL family protein N-acetyltransferase
MASPPVTAAVRVRRARVDDLPWALEECRRLAQFYRIQRVSLFPADAREAAALLRTLMEHHLFLVAERDGVPLGLITGSVSAHPCNQVVRVLGELFWWVSEQHRGSRAGLMLLDAFLEWGEANADLVVVGTIAGRTNIGAASMRRRGLHAHELSYVRETERGNR